MSDLTISLAVAGEEIVTGALRRVGEVAINMLGAAFQQVAAFAADSFKGAIEAQAGIDKLTGSITRLGDKSPISIEKAMDLSQTFKDLVGGSDDVVLAMEDVILRFDKISADTFPRVIEQSADLAVALGTSPTSAAQLLGKVLQDLGTDGVGSIGRLKAAGVALTDEQTKLIKSLVDAGDVAGAQKVLLDALAETTGGKAAANAETLAGKWDIFKETIADAGEGVAMKLLPALSELMDQVLPILLPIIENTATALGQFAAGIGEAFSLLASGKEDLSGAADAFIEFFSDFLSDEQSEQIRNLAGTLSDLWENLKTQAPLALQAAQKEFQPLIDAVKNIMAAFQESMPIIQGTVADMAAFVSAKFAELTPTISANLQGILDQTVIILNNIAAFWRAHGDEIMAVIDIAWKFIVGAVGAATAIFSGLIKALLQGINGDWEGAWATMLGSLGAFFNSALSIVGTNLDEFIASWQGTFSLAEEIVSTVFNNIVQGIQGKVAELVAAALNAANSTIAAIRDAFGMHSPSIGLDIGKQLFSDMGMGIAGMAGRTAGIAAGASQMVTNAINNGGNTYNYYGVQANMQTAYTRSLAGAF